MVGWNAATGGVVGWNAATGGVVGWNAATGGVVGWMMRRVGLEIIVGLVGKL